MSRMNVAIVFGCVSMLFFALIGLSVAYAVVGTEGAFEPESFKPSGLWTLVVFAVGVVAAALGAAVASFVGPATGASWALADVVLMLGFAIAVPVMIASGYDTEVRTGDLSVVEAFTQVRPPVWVALIYPLVAKVGVYLGAWMTHRA